MQGTIQVNSGKAPAEAPMGRKAGKRRQEQGEGPQGFEAIMGQCLASAGEGPSGQPGILPEAERKGAGIPFAGELPEPAAAAKAGAMEKAAVELPEGAIDAKPAEAGEQAQAVLEALFGEKPEESRPEAESPEGGEPKRPHGVRALLEEWVSKSAEPQAGEVPQGFLSSAKGRSLLNRMAELSGEAAGAEVSEPAGESVLQGLESASSKRTDVPLKGFLTEDGQLKRPGRPEEKGRTPEAVMQAPEKGEAPAKGVAQKPMGTPEAIAIENPEEIVETLKVGIQKLREDGKVVMRVRLKPEELGSIDMRLAWEAGTVKGRILVESESVREQLQTLLAEDRLFGGDTRSRPVAVEVAVDRQAGGFSGAFEERAGDFGRRQENGRYGGEALSGNRTERPEAAIPWAGRPSGLDLLA